MSKKGYIFKLVGFWVGFLVLHYAYEFFPILPFKLLSGIDESFFQHAKVALFAYLAVNLVEYLVRRGRPPEEGGIENVESFAFSHIFSNTILPWFVFIAWFAPGYGKWHGGHRLRQGIQGCDPGPLYRLGFVLCHLYLQAALG
jgi:hypothetical protein